jgi:origin recognition complex subunit 1
MSPAQQRDHDPRELFLSMASDENEIEAVDSGCRVLTPTEFAKLQDRTDATFYCTHLYNPIENTFEKLSGALSQRVGADAVGAHDPGTDPDFDLGDGALETPDEDSDFDEKAARTPKRKRRTKRQSAQANVRPTKKMKDVKRFQFKVPRVKTSAVASLRFADGDALDDARGKLHVSAVPDGLPCREVEFYTICEFVRDQIVAGTGACMFVSGVPGTGKTATIRQVARALQAERDEGNLVSAYSLPCRGLLARTTARPGRVGLRVDGICTRLTRAPPPTHLKVPFDFVEINGMALTTPAQAYCELWDAVSGGAADGRKVTPVRALDLLRKRFTTPSPRRKCTVLLVDELDQLWTRKQDVM